jgi:TonB-dependent receptor
MLFKKKVLSSSVALALVGSAMPALAQDEGLEIEEVIVEGGIRASLKKSMDLKRDTVGVADAISAEDMGKFPDTNLAESLQRITGVSINRSRGEGSKVTVRGFGPDYNLVTLNGRQMPTHAGAGRSFDFGDLASEGISAVVVKKTGDATQPSGGVGSLINIITTKPLEAGSVATFSAKAAIDTSTATGDTATPEFSGIYSETFADDTLGVALSFSSQERNNAVNAASVGGWWTVPADSEELGRTVPRNEDQVNRPSGANENTSIPQSMAYNLSEYVSERVNGQLTLQWRPVDSLTATVDYTYSEFDLERTYNDMSAWFNQGGRTQSSVWDEGPIGSPLTYSEVGSNDDLPMGIGRDGSANENDSMGLNLEWNVNDSLQLTLDHHSSSAERGANSPYGTFSLVTIASFNRAVTTAHFDQDLPILEYGLNPEDPRTVSDGGAARPIYKDDMIITGSSFRNEIAVMDIDQTKLGGTYDLSDVTSIDFGVELAEVSNRSTSKAVDRGTWGGITEPGEISDILVRSSMADSFDQISGGEDSRRHSEFFTTTLEQVIEIANEQDLPASQDVGDCGTPYCASTAWDTDKRTTEETIAAYVQLTHDTEYNGMPVNIRAGLRYEQTEVTSAALAPTYSDVYWEGGNEFYLVKATDSEGNVISAFDDYLGDYNLFLPNLDLQLDITDELVARASVSKTITRAGYNDIQGGVTVDGQNFKYKTASARGGNPGLLPIESTNFDLSAEWYYGEADYVSVGYYQKTVENFIGNGFRQEELFGLTDPASGGLYGAVAAANGLDPFGYGAIGDVIEGLTSTEIAAFGTQSAGFVDGQLYGAADNDPVVFTIASPVNEKTAKVDGIEINWQHNFGETGYGFIANATIANADVAYDPLLLTGQFALGGLSDSANLIGYYDKDGINVRVAYNWRDDFFNGMGQGQGSSGINPTQTEAFGQIDISASYELNDNLTIFMDGINVTEETYRLYGREKAQVLQSGQTGARYNLGVRYKF